MRNSKTFNNVSIIIFLTCVVLLSNGCTFNDIISPTNPIFEITERTLFESLKGLY